MKKVLFGGTFDLIHAGHVLQMKKAKEYGDYLIVNVSSDKQASQKGKNRPIIPQEERVLMVASIRFVNEVVCLDTEKLDLSQLLTKTCPDVLVTNEDNNKYDGECKKRNIEIVKLPRVITKSGLDTTGIIKKICSF